MTIQHIKMRWGTGDNYCYLLTDDTTKETFIIDPAEPAEVLPTIHDLVKKGEIVVAGIVNTHHHHDHSGGNAELSSVFPEVPIIAGFDSPLVTQTPDNGSTFKLGKNISIKALYTPCHTQDSISYFCEDGDDRAVFTGDTLFVCGCGRFFEGTAEDMDTSLNTVLGALPDDTVIYPGHEYTASNVKFATSVLKNSKALDKLDAYTNANEVTTGIFTIGDEKSYNPYMMLTDPQILKATGKTGRTEVMKRLREMKNSFR
ncbi:beta-lactamase-like protein [Myxozyma melibiosi]|uniref:hydroxyacylglutathione hydrolase n=1 Tax=Myxozyma melibiosi TaxID=54550 RepID=A0ABR1F2Y6_9ASCO